MFENKITNKTYICYEKAVEEHEVACIDAYWELEEKDHTKFKIKTPQIGKMFPGKPASETTFAYKKSSFTSSNQAFSCIKCGFKILVASRTKYLTTLNEKESVCEHCLSEEAKSNLEEYRRIVNAYIEHKKPSLDFFPEKLLYTEKLILLLAITDDSFIKVIENDAIYYILQSLCSKNIFMNLHEIPETVKDAFRELRRLENNYTPPIEILGGDFYFNKLDLIKKHQDIISFLVNEIDKKEVNIREIEVIKKLIVDEQKNKAFRVLDCIRRENRIFINESIELDNAMNFLCENYSPLKVYDLLNRTARDTIVHIHNNKAFIRKNLFTEKLNKYIDNIQSKKWDLMYTRALPEFVNISMFESFVNKMLFPYSPNWNNLSGNEVFDAWMTSLTVSDD